MGPPRLLLIGGVVAVGGILFAMYGQTQSRTFCYSSVMTLSVESPSANCFTVSKHGVFSEVFPSTERPKHAEIRDGHVLPGLWDGHGHILQYGEMLRSVNLFGSQSMKEARGRVQQYAKDNPTEGTRQEWIRGVGWDQAAFGGSMPTAVSCFLSPSSCPRYQSEELLIIIKADLEVNDVLKSKYIMLDRVDVHCIWVSQAVLDLLPRPLPTIPGGDIVTVPGEGVFCDNAMDFVRKYWPGHSSGKKRQFLANAMKELNKVGLVGIHDAGATPEELGMFKEAVNGKDWTVRIFAMLECAQRNSFCPQDAVHYSRDDGLLTVRSVKLFGGMSQFSSTKLIETLTWP
jgi:predicted amidohydrolase YtcJ